MRHDRGHDLQIFDIKKNLVKNYLDIFPEIAEKMKDTNVRILDTTKKNLVKNCLDVLPEIAERMKDLNSNHHVTGGIVEVLSSSPSRNF